MKSTSVWNRIKSSKSFGLLIMTIVLIIGVSMIEENFLSQGNIRQLLINMTVPGFMLIAVGPLLISGNMDLAAGAEAALGAMVFAKFLQNFPQIPWPVGLAVAMLVGVAFGFVYIFLVNKLKMMSFIASIAMTSVYTGLATMWTRTNNVDISRHSFNDLGSMAIGDTVPVLFVIMIVLVIVYEYILKRTPFGRSVYMVGGNPYAAKLAGLRQGRVLAILFINSCVMAVLAGVAWAAYKKMASPTNIANCMANYDALTACILGGISFIGGTGGMAGAFMALLLVKVFFNALNMLGLPSYVSVPMQGLILIVALILDNVRTRKKRKRSINSSLKM